MLFAPSKAYAADKLTGGQWLYPGQYLMSPNLQYKFIMQTDGNLVLYTRSGQALWASNTWGSTVRGATMRDAS
ncbi:MAG: hypothetical protein Q7T33_12470 [Dehalococcoidia bacterium]|nr:hypothetical protein [Dehalococcoidia bacterium]